MVTVLEQAASFSELGAGIQISPNATKILYRFGLESELEQFASRPTAIELRNGKTGARVLGAELGEQATARYGAPYLNIHRADLHRILVGAAQQMSLVDLNLNAECVDLAQDDDGITVTTTGGRKFSGDFLVGADGIKSFVRTALFGPEAPRFTGCVAWRGLIPSSALQNEPLKPVAALWMGPGGHFVHYYVRRGELINFVAVIEREGWTTESWTQRGSKDELVAAFHGWHRSIQKITAAADPEACFKWALFDRKPMPLWGQGKVTLLGDACHPTLPFMAQGACMSIEDAAVLGHCVNRYSKIEDALTEYRALRHKRTDNIQRSSRDNKSLYHMRGAPAMIRDLGAPLMRNYFTKRLDSLFGYDPPLSNI